MTSQHHGRPSSLANLPNQPLRRKSSRAAPGEKFDDYIIRRKDEIQEEHKQVSIWTSPILVISYFVMYAYYEARDALMYFYRHRRLTAGLSLLATFFYITYLTDGPHQQAMQTFEQQFLWYGYWILLGVASAIGLGTGLHTFLLFLGPYIVEVTMAAYECHSADRLTRDPTSYRLQCRLSDIEKLDPSINAAAISLWTIYRRVQWESFAWGAGTALGELPPYFVARAVALSGGKSEELAEFEAGLAKPHHDRSFKEKFTYILYHIMQRLGFFGILLFASIPNPLFDLAGITCGHFLVPFATFFGATFIGKAVVKAAIQSMIVILAFSGDTLSNFLNALDTYVPALHSLVERMIREQRHQIGRSADELGKEQNNFLGIIWNTFLSLMIGYFIISSIESLGLAYRKRLHEDKKKNRDKSK
ncbi:vacuole membrane protein 1 [Radiomyces spectabilis]|uniref:vacuole membrane protein 1 n=1 Tax=Radiomyces spectabilis TaxID=64574 RepID=UPI00222040FF|nr:vacuole membrane protein 1 [Radiomyces spectabilis]KAI8387984.1 vacuole membrane protein 1 [Radiomyces spectabilis]